MTCHLLDTLTRSVATGCTRRTVLAGLAVRFLPAVPVALGVADAEAKKIKKKRKKGNAKKPANAPEGMTPVAPPPLPPRVPIARIDAVCSGAGIAGLAASDGNYRFAQTFTPLASGHLLTVQMTVDKAVGSTGDYILQLLTVDGSGAPTNTVVATASIPNDSVLTGLSSPSFNFPTPPEVVAGTQYALSLTRPGSTYFEVRAHSPATCTGQTFYSTSQIGQFLPNDNLDADLLFVTFVSS